MKRRVRCTRCGRTLRVELGVRQHFHHCRPLPATARARIMLGGDLVDWPTAEDRRASIWSDFAGGPPEPHAESHDLDQGEEE